MRSSKSACRFENYLKSRMNNTSLERKQRSPRTLKRRDYCMSATESTRSDSQISTKNITVRPNVKKKPTDEMQKKGAISRSSSVGAPYQKNLIADRILAGNKLRNVSTPRSLPDSGKSSKNMLNQYASLELPEDNASSKKLNTRNPSELVNERTTCSDIAKYNVKTKTNDTKRFLKASTEEHEYLLFLLRITEDIISKDYYTNADIKRVCENHLEANKHHLDWQKMKDHIARLSNELNIVDETNISESNADSEIYYNKAFLDASSSHSFIDVDVTTKYRNCECATFRKSPLRSLLSPPGTVTSKLTIHKTSEEINIGNNINESESFKTPRGSTGFQETLKELRNIISEKDIDEKMSSDVDFSDLVTTKIGCPKNSLNKLSLSRVTECTEPSSSYNTIGTTPKFNKSFSTVSSFGNLETILPHFESNVGNKESASSWKTLKSARDDMEKGMNTSSEEVVSTRSDTPKTQKSNNFVNSNLQTTAISEKISGIKLPETTSNTKIQQNISECDNKISECNLFQQSNSDALKLQESRSEPKNLSVTESRKLFDCDIVNENAQKSIENFMKTPTQSKSLVEMMHITNSELITENVENTCAIFKESIHKQNSIIINELSENLNKASFESFLMKMSENDLLSNQQLDLESLPNSIKKISNNQINIDESISTDAVNNNYSTSDIPKELKTINSDAKFKENNEEVVLSRQSSSEHVSDTNFEDSIILQNKEESSSVTKSLNNINNDGKSSKNKLDPELSGKISIEKYPNKNVTDSESEVSKKLSEKTVSICNEDSDTIKELKNGRHDSIKGNDSEPEVVKKSAHEIVSKRDPQESIIESLSSPLIKVILDGKLTDQDYVFVKGPVYVLRALVETDPKLVVFANNPDNVENPKTKDKSEDEGQNENDSGPDSLKSNATYTVSVEPEPDLDSTKSIKNDHESVESIFRISSGAFADFFESKKNLQSEFESSNRLLYNSDYDLTPQRDENNYYMGSDTSEVSHHCSDDKYHYLMVDATTSVSNINLNGGFQGNHGDFCLDEKMGNNLLLGSDEYVLEQNREDSKLDLDAVKSLKEFKDKSHSLDYYFKLRKKFSESEYVNISQRHNNQSRSVPKLAEKQTDTRTSSPKKSPNKFSSNKLKLTLEKNMTTVQHNDEYLTESESVGEIRGDIFSKLEKNRILGAETRKNTSSMTSMDTTLHSEGETIQKGQRKDNDRILSAPLNVINLRKQIRKNI